TNALAVVGGGQFTYGKPNTNESNVEIAGHTDGLGVYGNTSSGTVTGNLEGYVTKAYYNGFTACNSSLITTTRVAPALTVAGTTHAIPGTLAMVMPVFTLGGSVLTYNICSAVTVIGGSNARIAQQDEASEVNAAVFPNPVSLSNPILNLNLNSASDQQIEIRITDMLGREVLNQKTIITEGQSLQTLQLPADIRAGVYLIMLNGEGIHETHRFIVE
ncbi:MAG: T9SS type A sorting domain-containing protein, partial [Bacteroidia bacterium]